MKFKRKTIKPNKLVHLYSDDVSLFIGDTFAGMSTLEDESIDMILADLPYGTTACKWDSVLPLDQLWREYERLIKPNGAIVLTAAQPFTWQLCASNPDLFRYEIIWEKPNGTNPMLVKKQPFRAHENILVFYKKQPVYNPQMTYGHSNYSGFRDDTKKLGAVYSEGSKNAPKSRHRKNTDGSRYPRSVQKFAQDRSGHPTKKPVDMFRWLIRTYSNEGDVILDNTIGEGTTAVAAVMENRKAIGIDSSVEYIKRAIKDVNQAMKEDTNV